MWQNNFKKTHNSIVLQLFIVTFFNYHFSYLLFVQSEYSIESVKKRRYLSYIITWLFALCVCRFHFEQQQHATPAPKKLSREEQVPFL